MKKSIFFLFFIIATSTAYGETAQADVKEEFITKLQSSLPSGWLISYDSITADQSAGTTVVHIKNLILTTPENLKAFNHQGEITIAIEESHTNISLTGEVNFNNQLMITAPITINFEVPKNLVLEKRWSSEFWEALTKLDLTVGKGVWKHVLGNNTVFANLDEFHFNLIKNIENPTLDHILVDINIKNLNFPPENKSFFQQSESSNILGIYGINPTDQGNINVNLKGSLKVPPYNELTLDNPVKIESLNNWLNKGYAINLTLVNTDDLMSNNNHLIVDLQADRIHFYWSGDSEVSELYTKKSREALLNAVLSLPKEGLNPFFDNIQKYAMNHQNEFMNLFPNLHEWGKVKTVVDVNAKVGNEDSIQKVDYDVDFSTEKSLYQILVKGFFEGKSKDQTLRGKTTITLKNYQEMFKNSVKFYNGLIEAYKSVDSSIPIQPISEETVTSYIDRIQQLASSKSDDGKEIVLIIDYTDPNRLTIGGQPINEALMGIPAK